MRKSETFHAVNAAIALLLLILVMLVMNSCAFAIPVRAVPSDEPILVANVGHDVPQTDGTIAHNPELPQPKAESFKPPVDGWGMTATAIGAAATLIFGGGGGLIVTRTMGKLKTAAKIACQLADDCAKADTDEQVKLAQTLAKDKQLKAGVHKMTQKIRGKT